MEGTSSSARYESFDEQIFSRLFLPIRGKRAWRRLITPFLGGVFSRALSTGIQPADWIDGTRTFPGQWLWDRGHLTTDRSGDRESSTSISHIGSRTAGSVRRWRPGVVCRNWTRCLTKNQRHSRSAKTDLPVASACAGQRLKCNSELGELPWSFAIGSVRAPEMHSKLADERPAFGKHQDDHAPIDRGAYGCHRSNGG